MNRPRIIRIQKVPAQHEIRSFIERNKRTDTQTTFDKRFTTIILRNFFVGNITSPNEIPKKRNRPRINGKRVNQYVLKPWFNLSVPWLKVCGATSFISSEFHQHYSNNLVFHTHQFCPLKKEFCDAFHTHQFCPLIKEFYNAFHTHQFYL